MYDKNNLSVLAYANGFTLWHYITPDVAQKVSAPNYFNTASDMLRVGDMIMVNTDSYTEPSGAVLLINDNRNDIVSVVTMTQTGSVV